MEAILGHLYAFAEIYSVLLCWLVVPLVYASAYFYFVRNLPVHSVQVPVVEAPPVMKPQETPVVTEASAPPDIAAVAPIEGPPSNQVIAEIAQDSAEAEPEAKVANG